eukprot:1174638-Rhodomonas_salina.1
MWAEGRLHVDLLLLGGDGGEGAEARVLVELEDVGGGLEVGASVGHAELDRGLALRRRAREDLALSSTRGRSGGGLRRAWSRR